MKCTRCGANTKVIDSRDDSSSGKEWLVERGVSAFGWWSRDFRLRIRKCSSCENRETTIEVPLDDLEASYADVRSRAEAPLETRIRTIPTDQLLKILNDHKSAPDALSHLLAELLFRGNNAVSAPID